jgi:hypothetical protein
VTLDTHESAEPGASRTSRRRQLAHALTRLVLVPAGGLVAVIAFAVVAGVIFDLGGGSRLDPATTNLMDWIFNMGFVALMLGGPPGFVLLMASEIAGIRAAWVYLLIGLVVLLIGWPVTNALFLGQAPTAASELSVIIGAMTGGSLFFLVPATAGALAAGLAYWLLVGRRAGLRNPD